MKSASLFCSDAHTIAVGRRNGQLPEQRDTQTCTLQWPRGSANPRGGREGHVVHRWTSRDATLDCASVKLDTPPAALAAPNGYMGARARICQCEGHRALSRQEDRKKK